MFDVLSPFRGAKRELFPGILTLCLFGFLLPARGQDPWLANIKHPMDTNVSVGATVILRAYPSTATPSMTLQWQHEGTNLPGATNSILLLTNLTVAHAGGYTAWITNAIGVFTNTRTATLTVDPTFVKIMTGPGGTDSAGSVGAAWADYDGDGFPDLFIANWIDGSTTRNTLWHNKGDGTFTKITTGSSVNDLGAWAYPYWIDYDNDGDLDLHVLDVFSQPDKFYRNDGNGLLRPLTPEFVKTTPYGASQGELCGWADFNNDGWLDVFTPRNNGNDLLFRGGPDGVFQSMTTNDVGSVVAAPSYQVGAIFDYDNDGWQDVLVSPSSGTSRLYHNEGHGFFQQIIGSAVTNQYTWNFAVGDYDNDGDFDLFAPAGEDGYRGRLYRNDGNGVFTNVAADAGVDRPLNEAYAIWADYDNDGHLDLFITTQTYFNPPQIYGSTNVMFHNNGDGTFNSVDIGSPLRDGVRRYTPTWVDYDRDGFLDFFLACGRANAERNYLYRNNLPATGNTNRWLNVRLVGKASNSMGVGAKVRVTATIRGKLVQQNREITVPGSVTQEDYLAHFGLGDATNVTTVRIEWPSGNVQELVNVTPDRLLTVTEPTLITPVMPSASLNGSVTLTRTAVAGANYQWRFDGVDLVGQTNRTLNLTNIVAGQEGRYSVVASNATSLVTNFAYLHVDTQFTKITEGEALTSTLAAPAPSWVDVDGDGDLDLVITGGYWSSVGQRINVFTNSGNGTLTRTHTGGLADALGWWYYQAWGDYDRDGDLDVFVGAHEARVPYLFRNEGLGQFTPVPANAAWTANGVAVRGATAAWGDYNTDGWLDLAVGYWGNAGGGAPYGKNFLLRSLGAGQLEALTNSPVGIASYVETWEWVDVDGDDDLDLFGATSGNASQKDLLFLNAGRGDLARNTTHLLVQPPANTIGQAWGDYDNDQDLDLLLTVINGASQLYTNQGGGNFAVENRGLAIPTSNAGRANWVDYDNDGLLDLFVACTDTRNRLFRNVGSGNFTEIKVGSLVNEATFGTWLGAWGDYDQDGFLDLFVANESPNRNFFYHNNPNGNHWLQVKLRGTTSNTDGLGALVKVRARIAGATYWQTRRIASGGQSPELVAHFGLGDATNVTTLRIEWPSGTVQELTSQTVNQILTIVEPRRPVLSLAATPAGFTGVLKADTNLTYQVHASDDVAAGWSVLTNVTSDATGAAYWSDPAPTPQGRRFYKAVKTP